MSILNSNINNKKNDAKILTIFLLSCIIIAWLCTPPGNKFIQVCFWGHNVQYVITKLFSKDDTNKYRFHWKNAIYLTRMNDISALKEMNKAIMTAPSYLTEEQTEILYRERAKMRVSFKYYHGALDDYLKVKDLEEDDLLRIALISKKLGKREMAISYCNTLLTKELGKDFGYACIADVYADAGKYATSIKVYSYLIDKEPNIAAHYIARANYRKMVNDFTGEDQDLKKARELTKKQNLEIKSVDEVMKPDNIILSKVF